LLIFNKLIFSHLIRSNKSKPSVFISFKIIVETIQELIAHFKAFWCFGSLGGGIKNISPFLVL
jgi:hypothetical protein